MATKMVKIGDFVTDAMMEQIRVIGADVQRLEREVIRPNMAEINRKLGQENDPTFLAYAIVWAIGEASK